jgi:hypothetical protein
VKRILDSVQDANSKYLRLSDVRKIGRDSVNPECGFLDVVIPNYGGHHTVIYRFLDPSVTMS